MDTQHLVSGLLTVNPALAVLIGTTKLKEPFANTSAGMTAFIIIIVIVAIVLWIMSLMATYRLTHSALQTVLCLLFGSMYLFFAWIYYGFTGHKLVKMSKA
jgi:hypothetical protein